MCFFALIKVATEHGARLRRGRGRRGHVFVAVVRDEIEHLHVIVVFCFFLKLEAYLIVKIVATVTAGRAMTLTASWCRGRLLLLLQQLVLLCVTVGSMQLALADRKVRRAEASNLFVFADNDRLGAATLVLLVVFFHDIST